MSETSRTQQSTRAEVCAHNHETFGNAQGCGEGFHRGGGIRDILQPIPIEEERQLTECESTIEKGLKGFVEVGTALLFIRNHRLYRGTYTSFAHYCRERWDMGKSRAHQMIEAAQIVGILPLHPEPRIVIPPQKASTVVDSPKSVPAPESERSIRPLSRLPKSEIPAAYERAVQLSGGKAPSSAQTSQAVTEQQRSMAQTMGPSAPEEASECIDGENRKRHSQLAGPSNGVRYAEMAITQLKKINPRDTQRTEAFDRVLAWLKANTK